MHPQEILKLMALEEPFPAFSVDNFQEIHK